MIHEKPKNEIFASDAKDGEIVEFPNVKRGWGVTENLGFIPPMEYFNAAFNRVDKALAYQSQRGVSEWSADEEYPIGALSVFNAKLYQAKTQNTNKKPSENQDEWEAIAGEGWSEKTFQKLTDAIDAYNKQESDERYAQKSDVTDGVKIGSYLLWSSQSVTPAGFLVCDGRSLKKSEYAELFAVVGYTYGGSGDDFNIPNFSDGKFMRSIGGNAAALGVAQQDEFKSHTHGVGQQPGIGQSNNGGTGTFAGSNNYIQSGATGGNETRPYNMSVVVLIKAKEVKEPNANQIDKSIYATEAKAGVAKLKNSITGKAEDVAVTEKAVKEFIDNGFLSLNDTNGYTRLPNGLILQWGKVLPPQAAQVLNYPNQFMLPIAFSQKLLFFSGSPDGNNISGLEYVTPDFILSSKETIKYYCNFAAPGFFHWFAIGY